MRVHHRYGSLFLSTLCVNAAMTVENPQRIQRKRTKGWTVQEEADRLGCSVEDIVYVGKGSRWGRKFKRNAMHSGRHWTSNRTLKMRKRAVQTFRDQLEDDREYRLAAKRGFHYCRELLYPDPKELRGKHLMCWCPLDQPCHADVLLELANKVGEDNG